MRERINADIRRSGNLVIKQAGNSYLVYILPFMERMTEHSTLNSAIARYNQILKEMKGKK